MMETRYDKWYSPSLGRDMEIKVYGHAGKPVLYIPCQNGRFFDFENFGMCEHLSHFIEGGEISVFSVDTIDAETWSDKGADPYWRIRRHESWVRYLTDEVVPFIHAVCRERGWQEDPGILVFGASLGATHAVNLYFRVPFLFDSLLALSGIYDISYGFDGYRDSVVYDNSPMDYLPNLDPGHFYMEQYRQNRAVICTGQGAWEIPDSARALQSICDWKGIPVWFDYWGYDVNHDWPWWYIQAAYFLPKILYD